jgi:WD40 repeat protein/serine/threonine protein kinase
MCAECNKNEEQIYYDALSKPPSWRQAYLKEACGDDAELLARIEALLRAHEQSGDFLDVPLFDPDVTLDTSPLTEGPGTVIGRYKLLEQIGEGGFGVVYMAEQQEPIRRRVALKIIKLGMDTKQVIARFEAERQALAMMDHPNIAKVLDAGATDTGRPYFVMELVKGIPITEYCDKNNLDTRQRLELFIDVCKAVQHAHQKGIIHRDIKPSNVMITLHDGKPVPKVIDFGIAKATSHRLTEKTLFTKYAQMIGTPEYMSPEQAEMSGLDIDTRTDIYSLGVLLYELLTSATPFDAKELREAGYIQMQRIIRETEPLRPSTKLNTMGDALTDIAKHRQSSPALLPKLVSGDLDWIAMKTLEKDRTRRYETASELAMDIQRHLSNEPVEASPPSTLYRFRKLVQKHRRTVAAVITIAATLIVGLVVSTTMYFVANQARQKEAIARTEAEQAKVVAEKAQKAEQEQRKLAETKAEDLRRSLYVNSIGLADASYREGNIGRVRELLNSCPNDLRGWEWNRLNYISDQSIMTLCGHKATVHSIALSPDGKRIVSGSSDKTIKVWDAATGAELITIASGYETEVECVAFTPDGKRIISSCFDGIIKLWDALTGSEVMTLCGGGVKDVAFSPDGRRIVSGGGNDKTIKVWDAATGAELMTVTSGHEYGISSLAFSPDGKRIVSGGSWPGEIRVWDAETGTKVMTIHGHEESANSVTFSPDGKRIVSCGGNEVKVWDANSGNEVMTLRAHTHWISSVSVGPDGKFIVSGSHDKTIKIWNATTGEEIMTLRGHEGPIFSVAFSPDGKRIISGGGDRSIKVWDVTIDRELAWLIGHRSTVSSIAFSPDGKRIVSGCYDGTIKTWDVATGSEIKTLIGHKYLVSSVAFSPDGKYIASGSPYIDNTIRIWDSMSGTEVRILRGGESEYKYGGLCVAFSPDGRRIVSGIWDGTVKVFDVVTGGELMALRGHKEPIFSISFSPDGKRIVSGSWDKTIKVWNAATGIELLTLHGCDHTGNLALSPDGKHIISGSGDGSIKVWDVATGAEFMTLRGHEKPIWSVAFSPDGKRIISGGVNRTIKVWDATTGAELMTLRQRYETQPVFSIAFSPDGKTIAAADVGGIVLWESSPPAGGYDVRKIGEVARKLVDKPYEKFEFNYELIDRLQNDKTIDEPVRKLALQIANSRKWEDGYKLNEESWDVVCAANRSIEDYRAALEKAQKANSLRPAAWNVLNTLGASQYRVGDYENALETLNRSEKVRAAGWASAGVHPEPAPENVAFIAMSLHKLGRAKEAKAHLERLRDLLKDERFAQDEQAKGLLAEAEKLIEGEK